MDKESVRGRWGWDLGLMALGLIGLVVWSVWSLSPTVGGVALELLPHQLTLLVLGPCTFVIIGLVARLVPLLGWTLVYAPRVGCELVPAVSALSRPAAWPPLVLVLLLGWGYLVAGFLLAEKTGLIFASACYLLAAGLLIAGLAPALRAVIARRVSIGTPPLGEGTPAQPAAT